MQTYLKLKKSNCQNCYKCIRNCPVKSIRFSSNQAHIVDDECILCGQCFVVCPQNAKEIKSDVQKAKEIIASGAYTVVSIAPSFVANFPGFGIKSLESALKKLGFSSAEETALGATVVKKDFENMIKEKSSNLIISSCCPSVNLLIQKYYPQALPYLAPVISPMQAHGKMIKEKNPEAKVVFIGPCISKKYECDEENSYIDCALTFEELDGWFYESGVELCAQEEVETKGRARFFPINGGIIKSMHTENSNYNYVSFDGVDNCMQAIEDIVDGKIENCFVELSACKNSCSGGPVMAKKQVSPIKDIVLVQNYASQIDFDVNSTELKRAFKYIGTNNMMPGRNDIESILKKMGKKTEEDELNCGACGYNTCKEKAKAVYLGKANLSMCLPFLVEKAESFSDIIIKNSPNAILVTNESLEVQQINGSAKRLLNIRSTSDVLGDQVIRILDPSPFLDVLNSKLNSKDKRVYLAEYKKYVEQSIIHDRNHNIIICIMRDVTDEENERNKKEKISSNTIAVTDKIIEKQMRVVQEIASLLGETTAETKIALTKLKESLSDE